MTREPLRPLSRFAITVVALCAVVALGVPIGLFYFATRVGDWLFLLASSVISAIAVISGMIVAIVAIAPVLEGVERRAEQAEEQLAVYRAMARSMLEELDEIISVLREIRDELKKVSE